MCESVLKTCFCVLTNAGFLPKMKGDVIGVDKGALICHKNGVFMTAALGDFDSVSPEEKHLLKQSFPELVELPCQKDVSDSEAAVLWAKQQGYDRIVLVTDMSGRFDHSYVNFRLVQKYGCELLDQQNHVFLISEGTTVLHRRNYQYISFFACEEAVVTLNGFVYPLQDYRLTCTDVLCLSNELLDEKGTVTTTGKLWCIQSRDKEKTA